MTYYVTFYPGRAGLSEYQYDVHIGGEQVASAKTAAQGAIVGEEVEARMAAAGHEAWRIGPICQTCGDDGDCPDCGTFTDLSTPLLAQCAHAIIDELRACDAALRRQGW